MVTRRQLKANRLNAKNSTGPKSLKGKKSVSQNALKHGLLSRHLLLPSDDPKAFKRLAEGLWRDWDPQGAKEERFLDELIVITWRAQRFVRVETGLFARYLGDPEDIRATYYTEDDTFRRAGGFGSAFMHAEGSFTLLCRYRAAIQGEFFRTYDALERLQRMRRGQEVAAPVAVDLDVALEGGVRSQIEIGKLKG
ncbi:MAG: hypothetical protein ACE5E4_12475 [Candidatus Binatia bacterium]